MWAGDYSRLRRHTPHSCQRCPVGVVELPRPGVGAGPSLLPNVAGALLDAVPIVRPLRPSSRGQRWRTWVYPFLLMGASCTLAALERDPQDDVNGLTAVVDAGGSRGFFRHERAALGVFPRRGWTLTLYVGDTRRFAPGTFLVLTRVDGHLTGELILDGVDGTPGPLEQIALTGGGLDTYLARAALDLRGLDRAVSARFGAPEVPAVR